MDIGSLVVWDLVFQSGLWEDQRQVNDDRKQLRQFLLNLHI